MTLGRTRTRWRRPRPSRPGVRGPSRKPAWPGPTFSWRGGFTVASERNLSERLLHLRDSAFAELGDDPPTHRIIDVADRPDPEIARRIEGTFDVPSFLTGDGGPGERFAIGPDGLPVADGTITAGFTCLVPRSLDPGPTEIGIEPGRPLALRTRPPRQQGRGGGRQRAGHGRRARHRLLCHRLDRHGRRGRGQRARDPPGPLRVPVARRPGPTGRAQHAVPRSPDDPPRRAHVRGSVPTGWSTGRRHR